MSRRTPTARMWAAGAVLLALSGVGCNLHSAKQMPRLTLFIGVDASASFYNSGSYDDAMSFLAHYIYGHLNGLGALERPRELFVGSIGGGDKDEPKAFHPVHDFAGKDVAKIEEDLRFWFPPVDKITDFNSYFRQVTRITKERNLVLAPISIVLVSDGVPDLTAGMKNKAAVDLYKEIDLSSLDYLARNVTVRIAYVSPKVGEQWRSLVPRQRVRLWTVEAEVMRGWNNQIQPAVDMAGQERLWGWVRDNVDFRVRSVRL
jgi:hypothetical protein